MRWSKGMSDTVIVALRACIETGAAPPQRSPCCDNGGSQLRCTEMLRPNIRQIPRSIWLFSLASAAALLDCRPVIAQSITPYYADTSVYDFPRFRVVDRFTITTPSCYEAGKVMSEVSGTKVRLTFGLEALPPGRCGHSGPTYDVVVDRMVDLEATLAAGKYDIEFDYLADGNRITRTSSSFTVDDGSNKCSRTPDRNVLFVGTKTSDAANALVDAVQLPASHPQVFVALGRPIAVNKKYSDFLRLWYESLQDTDPVIRVIAANASSLGIRSYYADAIVCGPTAPQVIKIVEYFNSLLGHFFLASADLEIAGLDKGDAGPGWQRTGETITGLEANYCITYGSNPTPLYRFYGTPGRGPNSHFFTADRRECGAVRGDRGWTYESAPFNVWAPVSNKCPPKSTAFMRLYNGRAAQNDSNHRYTTKSSIVDQMVAAGWKNEGVAFCIPTL